MKYECPVPSGKSNRLLNSYGFFGGSCFYLKSYTVQIQATKMEESSSEKTVFTISVAS